MSRRTHSHGHERPKRLPVYRLRPPAGDAHDYEKPARMDPRFIRGLGELLGYPSVIGEKHGNDD